MHKFHLLVGKYLMPCDFGSSGHLSQKWHFVEEGFSTCGGGTSMSGVRFGVHTEETLLHAAAYMDFQTYVRSLLSAGHGDLALQVWTSVAEVVHFPPPDEEIVDVAGLPAMRRMPCLDATCERCRRGQGGFRFPWVGVWCRRAVLVRPGIPAR